MHNTFRGGEGLIWLPQRGSIHESQGSQGDKLYSVNWPQDQEAAAVIDDPLVLRFSSFEAPLGGVGVAPSPTADNRVLVLYPFLFFFYFLDSTFLQSMRVCHVLLASTEGCFFLPACFLLILCLSRVC